MTDLRRNAIAVTIWIAIAVLPACTTMKAYPSADTASLRAQLRPGDDVRLVLNDGSAVIGTVAGTTSIGVSIDIDTGAARTIEWQAIDTLSRREASPLRTTLLVLTGGYVLASIWAASRVIDEIGDIN